MFSNEERMIYAKRQLVEVICQLRFPEILSIDASEPAAFQDRIRREYPQYEKKIEQLPPQMVNGKLAPLPWSLDDLPITMATDGSEFCVGVTPRSQAAEGDVRRGVLVQ